MNYNGYSKIEKSRHLNEMRFINLLGFFYLNFFYLGYFYLGYKLSTKYLSGIELYLKVVSEVLVSEALVPEVNKGNPF